MGLFAVRSAALEVGEQVSAGMRFVSEHVANWKTSRNIHVSDKIKKWMGPRGWTEADIRGTIRNPEKTVRTRDVRHKKGGGQENDPATAYFDQNGSYVVRNDKTGDIVQVPDRNDPNWIQILPPP
jgi:hypothetical protein